MRMVALAHEMLSIHNGEIDVDRAAFRKIKRGFKTSIFHQWGLKRHEHDVHPSGF